MDVGGPVRMRVNPANSDNPDVPFGPVEGGSLLSEPEMVSHSLDEYLKPSLAHVRRNADRSFAIHGLEEHLRAITNRLRRAAGSDSR